MEIGLGAGPLGALEHAAAVRLVHFALERGVRVFDTAPSYGHSEAVLGVALRGRTDVEVITKGGYGVPGVADWTPEVLTRGIDRALDVLCTDSLGAFVLHSCPAERLSRGDLVAPLVRAREAGKVRAIGYSGDADGLIAAARIPEFDVLEHSLSVLDREALALVTTKRRIAKRVLANAAWRADASDRPDIAEYKRRFDALALPDYGLSREELFLRFAAHAPGIAVALVGTTRPENLKTMLDAAARGPLPADILTDLETRWSAHGATWRGVI